MPCKEIIQIRFRFSRGFSISIQPPTLFFIDIYNCITFFLFKNGLGEEIMKIYVKNLVTVIMENLLSIDDNQHVKKYIFDSFKHNTKVN